MMRLFVVLVLLGISSMGKAQGSISNDTLVTEQSLRDSIADSFIRTIDESYTQWSQEFQREMEYVDSTFLMENFRQVPYFPDSVYLYRLDSLNSAITLSYNNIVRNFIELYTVKKRQQLATMLGLSEYYFPLFEEVLAANSMPLELKYLPVIESALNPVARSRARACGLWQFMYPTGKMYKLEINSYIDERYDPARATEAAICYLKDLYNI